MQFLITCVQTLYFVLAGPFIQIGVLETSKVGFYLIPLLAIMNHVLSQNVHDPEVVNDVIFFEVMVNKSSIIGLGNQRCFHLLVIAEEERLEVLAGAAILNEHLKLVWQSDVLV